MCNGNLRKKIGARFGVTDVVVSEQEVLVCICVPGIGSCAFQSCGFEECCNLHPCG